jgi:hypothetical protein
MHAGFSFSYPPISLLLRQPLSIKKSYAGAIHRYIKNSAALLVSFCDLYKDGSSRQVDPKGVGETKLVSLL